MSNKGLFRTEVIGNIGRDDARTGELPSGTKVAEFSLATDESYKNRDGEKVERTTWMKVKIYGRRAEVLAPYLTAGTKLFAAGKISAEGWTGDDETVKTGLVLTVGDGRNDLLLLGGGTHGAEVPETESDDVPLIDE